MRVISVINQKGGCGKTTTAINLSACLAMKKYNTLVVDMDPQSHCTTGLNAAGEQAKMDLRRALGSIEEDGVDIAQLIIPIHENLKMIPSLVSLAALEQELSGAANREGRLKDLLLQAEDAFDFVLIDSPPNLGILTINALVASTEVMIPVDSSIFSVRSLRRLLQVIEVVKKQANINPQVHILPTMLDTRTRMARTILDILEERYSDQLLKTVIRQSIHLKEAAGYGLPITKCLKRSLGYQDYHALTEEVLGRAESYEVIAEPEQEEISPPEAASDSEEMFLNVIKPPPPPTIEKI